MKKQKEKRNEIRARDTNFISLILKQITMFITMAIGTCIANLIGHTSFQEISALFLLITSIVSITCEPLYEIAKGMGFLFSGHHGIGISRYKWIIHLTRVYFRNDMDIKTFRKGIITPVLLFFLIPITAGIVIDNYYLFFFGILYFLNAINDIEVFMKTFKYKSVAKVRDESRENNRYIIVEE